MVAVNVGAWHRELSARSAPHGRVSSDTFGCYREIQCGLGCARTLRCWHLCSVVRRAYCRPTAAKLLKHPFFKDALDKPHRMADIVRQIPPLTEHLPSRSQCMVSGLPASHHLRRNARLTMMNGLSCKASEFATADLVHQIISQTASGGEVELGTAERCHSVSEGAVLEGPAIDCPDWIL